MAALGIVFEQQTAEGITLFALHLCRLNEIEMSPLYPFDFDALWCGLLRWNPTVEYPAAIVAAGSVGAAGLTRPAKKSASPAANRPSRLSCPLGPVGGQLTFLQSYRTLSEVQRSLGSLALGDFKKTTSRCLARSLFWGLNSESLRGLPTQFRRICR
jgi:hypothetical protein